MRVIAVFGLTVIFLSVIVRFLEGKDDATFSTACFRMGVGFVFVAMFFR